MTSHPLDPNGVRTHLGHYVGVKSMTSLWKSTIDAANRQVLMSVDIPLTGMKDPMRSAILSKTLDR